MKDRHGPGAIPASLYSFPVCLCLPKASALSIPLAISGAKTVPAAGE